MEFEDRSASGTLESNKSRKSQSRHHDKPKGILKNSNPNATYHKHHRRKLEELVENERPEIIPTHNHHGRHRHHHDHQQHSHKHHKSSNDEIYNNEKNKEKSRRHHKDRSSSSKHGHKHHHKHHGSRNSGENQQSISDSPSNSDNSAAESASRNTMKEGGSVMDEADDMSNIYDSPKVPPIPVITKPTADHEVDNTLIEALQKEEVVYDVPRSNPRKVDSKKAAEAIYVNNSFQQQQQDNSQIEQALENNYYDVPRSTSIAATPSTKANPEQQLEDFVEYDVPKIRDSLSTIEEEQYDVPKNIIIKEAACEDLDDPIGHNSEENLYENQAYLNQEDNKKYDAHNFSEFSVVSNSHTDDSRSSGYRSSSSPSIQSEELYVNESAIGSMEDTSSGNPSPATDVTLMVEEANDFMTTPQCKEIGVGTSASLPKSEKKKSKKEKKEKELKREQERAQAEAIDKEILGKKLERTPKPPKTYFIDASNKVELPSSTVSTSERKKTFLQSIENHEEHQENTNNSGEKKPSQQKDRCLDVYHETVRQRVTRSTEAVKDVFEDKKSTFSKKKRNAFQKEKEIINDDELPSVRELRSKFENGKKVEQVQPTAVKKSVVGNKIDFKKGFNVMSSLTRRGALSVSKSMQNLSSKEPVENKKPTFNDDIGFDHFTYQSEKQEPSANQVHHEEVKDSSKEDPLYVNLETARSRTFDETPEPRSRQPEANSKSVNDADQHHQETWNSEKKAKRSGAESSTANKLLQSAIAEMEENENEMQTGLGPWNPQKTVAHLYKLQNVITDPIHQGAEEMEGYIERLPPGKKKSTIWNSWKRQYFVAKAGLLLIFGDSSRSVLMDRIELFGGRVDYMECTMLGIQDRRGHYVVLRFKDGEEADKWHSGLSTHVSHDLAQTFVTPVSVTEPKMFKSILVVDFGGSSVRAGIACSMPTLPQLFFPSVMAIGKGHEDEKYFGLDAFAPEVRSRCNLVHPFAPSSNVDKYTINQIALQGFLEKIFKDLNIDPSDYEIQLVSPRPLNDRTQKQLASLLFDEFGVKALNMAHQSIMAMYAYNAHSGIVVDLGERMDVIPIVDGYRVSAGVSRAPVGGPQMRQKLQHYLLGRNYSLTTFADSFVVRTALESLAYMSRNFDRELERYHKKPEKIDCILELSKSTKLEMGSERFEATEGLFKPELWGLDQAGVHVLVHKAIRECSMDVRKEITQSIFLAGGLSMIPGLRERMELELEKLSPATKPRVHGSPYRYHASYLGATVHANSTAFKQTKLTRDEWIGASHRLPHPWNLA